MRIVLAGGSALLALALGACGSLPDARRDPLAPLRAAFDAADANDSESLDRDEAAAGMPELAAVFDDVDTDGNGEMTAAELRSYLQWQRVLRHGPPREGKDERRR
ncbi:hypothetical protein [Sinimarinibacterium thermocellulolyticum]|uniref:EF-hand domain-containing protein n=1 Tax=Sinimarinibacterium thermocellulolyticum TaxID=3170016 RepID=A0ABV2AC46_9GAMM